MESFFLGSGPAKEWSRKVMATFMVATLVFGPAVQVFAQEVPPTENGGSGSIPPADVPSDPPADPSLTSNSNSPTPNSSEESVQTDSNAPAKSDTSVAEESTKTDDALKPDDQQQLASLLSIDPNKWLNSYADNLHLPDTSHVSGAFTYAVDIHTPPGRNGVQPNLQLKYNNQDKNPENLFGTGWTLNIPSIEQLDKSGTEDLYAINTDKFFTSSADGELTQTHGAAWDYMAKADDGSYNKYYFSYGITAGAKVVDKNGTIYTYGTTSASQLSDPSDSTHIFRWMLDSVTDVNGNSMVYQYTKDNGQIYPSKIIYTNTATTSAAFTIEFVLENRTDAPFSYKAGFKVSTLKRIARIDVKKNGAVIHKFDFAYTTGQNTVKSLLSSITETGYDEASNPTALPAIGFQYQTWDTTWTQSTPANTPPDFTDSSGKDTGYRIFNYLRDGKTQAILLKDGATATGYNPPDWTSVSVDNANPRIIDSSGNDKGAGLVDINGDLFPDITIGILAGTQNSFLWTPSGRFATTTMANYPVVIDQFGNDMGIRFGDLNNDGYADYLQARQTYSQNTFLNLADGTGWDNGGAHNMGYFVTGSSGNDYGGRVADLNGDGMDDYILRRPGDATIVVLWNKGTGRSWEQTNITVSGGSNLAPNIAADDGKDIGTRLTDINGDGLTDFVVSSASRGTHFYINMGDGLHWKDAASSTIPLFLNSSEQDIGTRFVTANFDGIPDFVTSSPLATKYNYISNGKPVDVLKTITLPQGGTIGVTYKGTAVDSVVFQTVDTITRNPQISGQPSITDTYNFSAGEFKVDYRNRTFRGFGIVEQTDSLSNSTKTYYYQGNGNNTGGTNQAYDSYALGEYNDTDGKMYKPFRVERKTAGASYPDTVEIYKYDTKAAFGSLSSTTLAYLKDALKMDYDGNSTHRDTAVSSDIATTTGNVIQQIQWGEVTGSDNGTFSDTGSDKFTTNISYATSSPVDVIGLVSAATTTDQSSSVVNATRRYYDSSAFGLVTKGLETKTEFWKSGNSYASTTKTYNVYGMVATSTDARSKSTAYVYDSLFLYPATTTNALGQQTGTVYNYDYGKVKAAYDTNNRLYTTTYDGLGRVKDIKQPDLITPSTLVSKTAYTYTDNSVPNVIQQTDYLNSATSTNTYSYYDGFGRVLQNRKTAENSAVVVKDYSYNNLGLKATESLPYYSTGTSNASATSTSYLYIRYAYDALKRPLAVGNVLGTTTTTYDQWSNVITDALGKYKTFYDDAYNNLVQVDEHATSSTFTTTYQYNGNNLLTKITDALGNIRNFTYDGMGRRLTAEDLRAVADGSYGTWTYTYDDASNITQVVDPKSQTVNYTYDNLSRVLTEDYTGAGGTELSYGYDSCTDGKTRLCAATSTDAVTNLTYNANGGIASEKKTVNSTAYTNSYSYDRQGNITDIMYPDTSIVKYGYDNAGLLDTITRKSPNSSTYNYAVRELQYAPNGAVSYKKFGNDVISTYTYDPAQLYRLTHILTVASTTVQGGGGVGGPLGLLVGGSHFAAAPVTSSKIAIADVQPLASATFSDVSISQPLAQTVDTLNSVEIVDQSTAVTEPVDVLVAPAEKKLTLDSPQDVIVNGKTITFGLTDNNSGEDLIVRTDSQDYSGISQADVYFSVENTSKVAQSVDLGFFFSDTNKGVSNIERLKVLQAQVPTYSKDCTVVAVASSTQKSLTTCNKTITGTRTVSYAAQTSLLKSEMYDENIVSADLANGTAQRKSVSGYVSVRSNKDIIQSGERAYYKATIHFGRGSSGEFFIEAVGDKGGYGHLDPWYSSSWTYRKQITITGSSGAGTGYQVLLKVGESSGASGEDFDLAGHSANFPSNIEIGGDLRFTASDGVTELPFWVEYVNGASTPNRLAYIWVKVGDDLGTNKTIYVYYGNAGASDAMNGFNTFNFFDSFSDGVINGQKWTTVCSTGCNVVDGSTFSSMTESGGVLYQYDQPSPASASRLVASTTAINTSGLAVKRRFFRMDDGTYGNTQFGFGTGNTGMGFGTTSPHTDSNNFQNNTKLSGANIVDVTLYGSDLSQASGYIQESRRISSTKAGAVLWGDNEVQLAASTTAISPSVSDTEYPFMRSADGHDIMTDWFLVRKFVETEPAFSSSAAEENFASSGSGVVGALQDIYYTYDAVGNITRITDVSSTNAAKTVNFTYDDLYRLTVASTTSASSTPYVQTYTYNAIGNIANKSDAGSYSYAGTGNANPHAATTVGSTSYTYDNNGNGTAAGTLKYAWDYSNRMISSGNGTATSTFGYDHMGQRVKKVLGATTTIYPNKYISLLGATTTDYVYLGDSIIAEIESGTSGGGGGGVSTSTPAYVQSKDDSAENPVTLTSAVTTGNLIVVGLTTFNTTIPSNAITDNKGNTYVKVAEAKNGTDRATIFYAKNVTGGSSFTVTSSAGGTMSVHEYSGISTSSPFDKVASSTGTSVSPSSGNITTSIGNELYFGIAWSGGNGDTWTATNGYTLREQETDNNSFERAATEDRVITSASTTAARFTTSTSAAWAVAIATFRPATTTGAGGGGSTGTTTRYFHADILNSTNVVSDYRGNIVQTLDYYPYGATRINQSSGGFNEKRQFLGEYKDIELNVDLSYLNNRYYNGTTGRFLSEDPIFWNNSQNLRNPQSLNSYSYANGNPIVYKDPNGNVAMLLPIIAWGLTALGIIDLSFSGYDTYLTNVQYPDVFTEKQKEASRAELGWNVATLALPKVGRLAGAVKGELGETTADAILTGTTYLAQNAQPLSPSPAMNSANNNTNQLYQSLQTNIQNNTNNLQSYGTPTPFAPVTISSAFSSLASAFTPTNSTQQKALQDLFNAFSIR